MDIFDFMYEPLRFDKNKPIKLFEAFSGIGTQSLALKYLGLKVEHIGISEVDKHAIKSYEAIHGKVKNYGGIGSFDKLPKFNNGGKMQYNHMPFSDETDKEKKIHPTQKPLSLLKRLIELYTDEGDVVIDPVAGSGSTLLAAKLLGRNSYGFEIKRDFYREALNNINEIQPIRVNNTVVYQENIFNLGA